jgi:hypothetical protein
VTWLRIKNWERFQHYKDRRPPWIKLYVDLLDDAELQSMPWQSRLLYCLLLLVAARKENRFPANPVWIAAEVALPLADVRKGLRPLLASGHLEEVASENASPSRARTRSASVSEVVPSENLSLEGGSGGTIARQELEEVMARELGTPMTRSEHGRRGKAIKELLEVGATAEDVRRKCESYRTRWPNVELTAMALINNWSQLERPAPSSSNGLTSRQLIDAARERE